MPGGGSIGSYDARVRGTVSREELGISVLFASTKSLPRSYALSDNPKKL